jgi:hypothetical protein
MSRTNIPLPTPSAKVIPFARRPNVEPTANRDQRIREYLRSIYTDPTQPLETRVKAAIFSPWFGERWERRA